jgi:photosystem II stability/assembly factor-like uncharacterized protein
MGMMATFPLKLYSQNQSVLQVRDDIRVLNLRSGAKTLSVIPSSYEPLPAAMTGDSRLPANPSPNPDWALKFTAAGKVFKDVSFADPLTGYVVTELGAVYKTIDGGDAWVAKLNLGFPYYWYGVEALTPDTVIIAGFNNQGPITGGVVRWTYDGGATWSPDLELNIPMNAVGWLDRVHFFNPDTGMVLNSFSGGCWYTATGGKDTASWTYININPDLAWFAGNIDAQPSGQVFATGIHLAHSADFGVSWSTGQSADSIFDGGVDFVDPENVHGWTGGGQISAPVAGWVRRTTDGGQTWSPRLKTFAWPIRALLFLDDSTGWAVGGNLYDEAGGIWSTTDGGLSWNPDVNTAAEMFSLEFKPVSGDSADIWCAGSTGGSTGFTGKLYKKRIGFLTTGIENHPGLLPERFSLEQNFPNPFSSTTEIEYTIQGTRRASLMVYDIMGNRLATLLDGCEVSGAGSVLFDGSDLASGVYYYQLRSGQCILTRKMVLSR